MQKLFWKGRASLFRVEFNIGCWLFGFFIDPEGFAVAVGPFTFIHDR